MALVIEDLNANVTKSLSIVSYNLHGFYQGVPTVEELIKDVKPDVFMLQEHWLTPANLCLFDKQFANYFAFGSSALSSSVASGMLRGRPFGGVITLISNDLRKNTVTIHSDDRFVIVKVGQYLLVNVYFPCSGSADRFIIYENLLSDITTWRDRYRDCECIIAGDFNCNLDGDDAVSLMVQKFICDGSFLRCDDLFPCQKLPTYVNVALNQQSCIDYVLSSAADNIKSFAVVDPNINFSDHLPLIFEIVISMNLTNVSHSIKTDVSSNNNTQYQLRWDKANKESYYCYTGTHLSPLVSITDDALQACTAGVSPANFTECIERVYGTIVSTLLTASGMFVPTVKKGFFKFWWSEELDLLKEASVKADKLWKATGKPRDGPIFADRQTSRLQYRKCLRDYKKYETECYTNDLHDALLQKNSKSFWQSWHSKFGYKSSCTQVDGCVDADVVASKFRDHFSKAYSCNNADQAEKLKCEYQSQRSKYCGMPISDVHTFDTDLVSHVIADLKCGKATGIDGLSAEHLLFCHPAVCVVLAKLFQLMMLCCYIPDGFRYSFIVPIPKPKECFSKSLVCNDFRGIAISPIISKVFEYCILEKYNNYLSTTDNQFGFKKGVGCSFAIRTVRNIVDSYIKGGSTANLCAIDLSKAFDKVNHHALFLKLMKRHIPNELLNILDVWLSTCYSCVKWLNTWSNMFQVNFGVRQGSVLSPFLFAVYLDDVAKSCLRERNIFIILYADDILLLAPSVCELDALFKVCERELKLLDMAINFKKSHCIRVGSRIDAACVNLCSSTGISIPWVSEIRYLGVYILRSRTFKCSLSMHRRAFYCSANAILGKVGRVASEEVVLQLIKTKCIPSLLYGLEACPLVKSEVSSLDFVVNRFFMKMFRTSNIEVVRNCQSFFGFNLPSELWSSRVKKFDVKYATCGGSFVNYGNCVT